MKLWLVEMAIPPDDDGMAEKVFIQYILRIKEDGLGWLRGRRHEGKICSALVALSDACSEPSVNKGWECHWAERTDSARREMPYVMAMTVRPGCDVTSLCRYFGVNSELAEAMMAQCYGNKDRPMIAPERPGRDCITMTVSVDGIDEAIRQLKVLEAQLHGVRAQTEKIGAAIDALQLKLENRIESVRRPDK